MRIPNKKARRLASLFCWAYVHQKPPDEFIKISGVFLKNLPTKFIQHPQSSSCG